MEKITTNNSLDIFSAAYALETDNYGNTFIATDNGIFYYNGKELLKYNKCSYNYIDIINFYKETNGNIWALPYYGKVFESVEVYHHVNWLHSWIFTLYSKK